MDDVALATLPAAAERRVNRHIKFYELPDNLRLPMVSDEVKLHRALDLGGVAKAEGHRVLRMVTVQVGASGDSRGRAD